jgi:hypothetical protein
MFQMPKRKREEKMKPTSKTAQRNNWSIKLTFLAWLDLYEKRKKMDSNEPSQRKSQSSLSSPMISPNQTSSQTLTEVTWMEMTKITMVSASPKNLTTKLLILILWRTTVWSDLMIFKTTTSSNQS